MSMVNRAKGWLLPAVLILFLLEIILFPFVTRFTYAGRSKNPNHVLTYTTHQLTWDNATGVDPDTGAARLSLFSSSYQNVMSKNDEKVVAPGTEGTNIVRLSNNAGNAITYTAVIYRMKTTADLPVEPVLADSASFAETETYPLPDGVAREQVLRAVTGSLESGRIQDFDISWLWKYQESSARDVVDTALGDKAAQYTADDVTIGLYIVVEEQTSTSPDETTEPGDSDPEEPAGLDPRYIYPQVPQTGDPGNMTLYLVLLAVSGTLFLLLLLERRKEKR